jgi:SSS family solute:Na+ symporter
VFVVSVVVMIVVSYATAAPTEAKLVGLTLATVTAEHRAESRSSWSWREVVASGLVLLLILAAYLYFRG